MYVCTILYGWREAHQRSHLRGNPRCPQGVPGKRHQGRSDLHRARKAEDGDRHGRGVRARSTVSAARRPAAFK